MTRYIGSEADRWFLAMGLPDMPDRTQPHPSEWAVYGLPPRKYIDTTTPEYQLEKRRRAILRNIRWAATMVRHERAMVKLRRAEAIVAEAMTEAEWADLFEECF